MTPERWARIKELFDGALERDSGERAAFLAGACGGDEDLRAQVLNLLVQYDSAGDFLENPRYPCGDSQSLPNPFAPSFRLNRWSAADFAL